MLAIRLLSRALLCTMLLRLVTCTSTDDNECDQALLPQLKRSFVQYSGIISAGCIALLGHLVKSYFDRKTVANESEVDRLGKQIELFFGPIDGYLRTTRAGFNSLIEQFKYWCDDNDGAVEEDNQKYVGQFFGELTKLERSNGKDGNEQLLAIWTDFVREIAYPVNKSIRDILASKAHLYDGSYPDVFETIFDLVAEREMMLKAWDRGNYTNLKGRVTFPQEADVIVRSLLKQKQARKANLLHLRTREDEVTHDARIRTTTVDDLKETVVRSMKKRVTAADLTKPLLGGQSRTEDDVNDEEVFVVSRTRSRASAAGTSSTDLSKSPKNQER